MGIEPTFEAWEAPVLPLNYTRDMRLTYRDPHHYVTGLLRTVTPGIHASRDTCTSLYIVPVLRPYGPASQCSAVPICSMQIGRTHV
jgi:hypothetical protein